MPDRERRRPAPARLRPALLHELADPAARRPLRAPRRVQRRPGGQDHARPRAAGGGRAGDRRPARRASARAPRWWRSRTRPARSRRWSAAPTSRAGPSTSPPTATASPARRSSRSSSSRALEDGVGPDTTFTSQQKNFPVPNSKGEKFVVNNYEDAYCGRRLAAHPPPPTPTTPCFAELGLEGRARSGSPTWPTAWASRTEISTNPAMTLGGLEEGVTPLEMAYAYSTIANKGVRESRARWPPARAARWRSRASRAAGATIKNKRRTTRVFSDEVGETAQRDARRRGDRRHRQGRADRRVRRRQDRHHRELRRRLVRRLQRGADRRRLGRLPGRAEADEDRVRAAGPSPAAPTRPRSGTTSCAVDRHPRPARGRAKTRKDDDETTEDGGPIAPVEPAEPRPEDAEAAGTDEARPAPSRQAPDARAHAPAPAAELPRRRRDPAPDSRPGAGAGPRAPAPPSGGGGGGRRARVAPTPASRAATGREREPAAASQKRQGSSIGLRDADPLAGHDLGRGLPAGAGGSRSARRAAVPLRSRPIPSAWVSLPGPEQRSSRRGRARAARASRRGPRAARARGSGRRRPLPPARTPR